MLRNKPIRLYLPLSQKIKTVLSHPTSNTRNKNDIFKFELLIIIRSHAALESTNLLHYSHRFLLSVFGRVLLSPPQISPRVGKRHKCKKIATNALMLNTKLNIKNIRVFVANPHTKKSPRIH